MYGLCHTSNLVSSREEATLETEQVTSKGKVQPSILTNLLGAPQSLKTRFHPIAMSEPYPLEYKKMVLSIGRVTIKCPPPLKPNYQLRTEWTQDLRYEQVTPGLNKTWTNTIKEVNKTSR